MGNIASPTRLLLAFCTVTLTLSASFLYISKEKTRPMASVALVALSLSKNRLLRVEVHSPSPSDSESESPLACCEWWCTLTRLLMVEVLVHSPFESGSGECTPTRLLKVGVHQFGGLFSKGEEREDWLERVVLPKLTRRGVWVLERIA